MSARDVKEGVVDDPSEYASHESVELVLVFEGFLQSDAVAAFVVRVGFPA